jgi:hypothetical protein
MQAKNDISEELRSISVLVDGISRQVPYEVPAGYFDSLSQLVLGRISAKSLTFSVPDGYFDSFASRVLDRIKAGQSGASQAPEIIPALESGEGVEEELARLSAIVSGISRRTPYQLPEGYFEEISPVLTLIRGKATYQAPAGYFDRLAAETVAMVSAEAVKAQTKTTVKAVEVAPATARATAKVIGMGRRKSKIINGNWWKYSAAALVAGLILTLSWPQLHTTRTDEHPLGPMPMDLSRVLNKVSDQEIQNYMDDQNSILAEPVTNSTATLDINDNDVKSLLGDVPDGELKQYLDEHGRANDIATN